MLFLYPTAPLGRAEADSTQRNRIEVCKENVNFVEKQMRNVSKGLRINANDRTCLKTTSPEAAASAMAAHVFPLT